MNSTKSKREAYATPIQIIGNLLAMFVPIFAFLFSDKYYPLENDNSKIFWEIPLSTYIVCLIVFILLRKDFLEILILPLFISIFASFFALACFFTLNASLDQSTPTVKDYTIVNKYVIRGKGGGDIFKIQSGTEQKTLLDVPPDLYDKGQIGGPFQRIIGQGFFNQPWIKEQKIP